MSRDDAHWVYATSTGPAQTVHLIRFEDAALYPNPAPICGSRGAIALLVQGDETVLGFQATCRRCRRIAGVRP